MNFEGCIKVHYRKSLEYLKISSMFLLRKNLILMDLLDVKFTAHDVKNENFVAMKTDLQFS